MNPTPEQVAAAVVEQRNAQHLVVKEAKRQLAAIQSSLTDKNAEVKALQLEKGILIREREGIRHQLDTIDRTMADILRSTMGIRAAWEEQNKVLLAAKVEQDRLDLLEKLEFNRTHPRPQREAGMLGDPEMDRDHV